MHAATPPLDAVQLSRIVQAVDPAARLVPARLVRRAIRWHYALSSSLKAPHEFCFEIARDELLGCIDAADLRGDEGLPERVLLLPLPEEDQPSTEQTLLHCWRSLFHAAIDRELDWKRGDFTKRPALFNATVVHEIRTVLQQEERLPPAADEHAVYREFTAFYLELKFFAPEVLETYFPGFLDPDDVLRALTERLDATALWSATRPAGAPAPGTLAINDDREPQAGEPLPRVADLAVVQSRAKRAHDVGNDVRAAVLDRCVGDLSGAESSLRRLVERLRAALGFDSPAVDVWLAALRPLLAPAMRGFWPVAGRLLYELQRACLDVERNVYAVDIVEWAVTLGEQRLKRLLDKPRDVNVLRRLQAALKLSPRAGLTAEQLARLEHLLHQAIADVEGRVRRSNRPILEAVLDEVGIVPENLAERVTRGKLVEELLDVVCARGFLKMTDLRDAIARNRLKLNDLSGPRELIFGDPLIRANRKLALKMDGIYRRGEIYMRTFQRGSSVAFGTAFGRLLTLFVALPFGGALILLKGLHFLVVEGLGLVHFVAKFIAGPAHVPAFHSHGAAVMTTPPAIGLVGLLILGMIHVPRFRRQVGSAARTVFLDIPAAILHSPLIRCLFVNAVTRFMARYLLTPAVVGALAALSMRLLQFDGESARLVGAGLALFTAMLFRSPWGRGLEERFDESLARVWRVISVNFMIGLLLLIVHFFMAVMEQIEKAMYAVDEWLRFHEGDRALSVVFKVMFGTVWFFIAYLFRVAWNLLIEPQINPVKHFPVVTVSHKLISPTALTTSPKIPSPFAEVIMRQFHVTAESANAIATSVVTFIPGIFGFLVWELKENWKLYKANRPPTIGPVPVGSHGERIRALLRPGLHSGVVPKTFAKLRKAECADRRARAGKLHQHLEHVAEAVHHLADRELAAYLHASWRWDGLPIAVDDVRLATNRLRVFLSVPDWEGRVVVSIEERGGWLIGSLEDHGWVGRLSDKQRTAFQDALTAFYKLAGVDVLREQAAAVLGVEPYRLDCQPRGLLVLPKGEGPTVEIAYDDEPTMTPSAPIDGRAVPPLPVGDLFLSDCALDWQRWVERWEQDIAGKAPLAPLLEHYRVLGASAP